LGCALGHRPSFLKLHHTLGSSAQEWLVSYGYFVTRRLSRMARARMPLAA
jgi:hypothetical protein